VPVAALQALLDDGLPPVASGDALPPLWHWVALPSWSPSSELREDGHALKGSFLPPVPLPRRMFAGGEVVLHQPLTVGAIVRRESEVVSVEHKQGSSGELVFVQITVQLRVADGGLAVEEHQTILYRAAGVPDDRMLVAKAAESVPGAPLRNLGQWRWSLTTDPTLLMRFSAATANAHRIHYDWPYATQVEGYPGLVVQGPLMTLALAETVRLERPRAVVHRLKHRNVAPLYCGDPATLELSEQTDAATGEELTLCLQAGSQVRTILSATLSANPTASDTTNSIQSSIPQEGHHHA